MVYNKCSFDNDFVLSKFDECKTTMSNILETNYVGSNLDELKNNNRLCSKYNGIIYKNCVVTSNNPWLVRVDDQCTLPTNISLPDNSFTYDSNDDNILIKPEPFEHQITKVFEERWYDWFAIPDYYHGNMYASQSNINYEPCKIGNVPYSKDISKCIHKNDLNYGMYKDQISYTPLQLVLLFGHASNTILEKVRDIKNSFSSNINSSSNYVMINNQEFGLITDKLTFDSYLTHNETVENHSNEIETYRIKAENALEIDDIIVPNRNIISASAFLHSKENITDAYKLCDKKIPSVIKNINDVTSKGDKLFYKSCDICFNGNSTYSKNLMHILNENEINKKEIKQFDKISKKKDDDGPSPADTPTSVTTSNFEKINYKTEKSLSQKDYFKYLLVFVKIAIVLTFVTFIGIILIILALMFKDTLMLHYTRIVNSLKKLFTSIGNFISSFRSSSETT